MATEVCLKLRSIPPALPHAERSIYHFQNVPIAQCPLPISRASRSKGASGFTGFHWLGGMKPCGLIIYWDCMCCTFHHICTDVHVAFVADLIHLSVYGLFLSFFFFLSVNTISHASQGSHFLPDRWLFSRLISSVEKGRNIRVGLGAV